jgi:Zn-dependent oligopeptidase
VNARLAAVKTDIDKVTAVTGEHTVVNTVRPYDDALNELALAGNEAYLMYAVGDAAPLRDKGQALVAKISSVQTDLSLNQAVYKALAAVPPPGDDPATKHYVERALLEYRPAGVERMTRPERSFASYRTRLRSSRWSSAATLQTASWRFRRRSRSLMACPRITLPGTNQRLTGRTP